MLQSKAALVVIAMACVALGSAAYARGTGKHSGNGNHRHHAHHGGARYGVIVGAPVLAAPYLYGYSYYPPYYAPYYPSSRDEYGYQPPPVYIQQAPAQPQLYFCPTLNAYYPQVRDCPGGWQAVIPPG